MIPQLSSSSDQHFFDHEDWRPNAAQAKSIALWLSDKHRIIALEGGWGCGKTTLIPMLMQANHDFRPGQDGLILSPTMGQGTRTISKECARLLMPTGWTYHHSYLGQPAPHWLSPMKNGKQTKVWFMSWNRPSTRHTSANSLEGPSVSYIIADECNMYGSDEPFKAALGRIRDGNPPKLMLLGKPSFGCIWRKFSADRGGYEFQVSSRVNFQNLGDTDAWLSTMSRREILENIDCNPQPPEGGIFDMFMPEFFPAGNLAPRDWQPQAFQKHYVSFDFGVKNPAAVVLAHDEELDAYVVWSEFSGSDCSVFEMCDGLKTGFPQWGIPGIWPGYRHDRPHGVMPITAAYGDRAGRGRRDDGVLSCSMDDVLTPPGAGGLGLRVGYTDDREKIDVNAGIRLLWSLIETNDKKRRLLCSFPLWQMGRSHEGRSFARSINEYRWARGHVDRPDKTNGADHHMDALRYFAVNALWPRDRAVSFPAAAFRGNTMRTSRTRNTPGLDR